MDQRIASLESAMAEETRLKCEYYAEWQQAKRDEEHFRAEWQTAVRLKHECWRERDRLAMQLAEKEIELNALQVEAMELRLAKAEPRPETPDAAQPSMYPWMEGEDKPAAAQEEHDRAVRMETAKRCIEIVQDDKFRGDPCDATVEDIRREFGLEGK